MRSSVVPVITLGVIALIACGRGADSSTTAPSPEVGAVVPSTCAAVTPDNVETLFMLPGKPWFQYSPTTNCRVVPAATVEQVAVRANGEIVLAGSTAGPADFGLGALPDAGGVFVAQFAADGHVMWNHLFASGGYFVSLAVDEAGNIGVARAVVGALNEQGPGAIYVDQLGPDGSVVWSKTVASADHHDHLGVAISRSSDGWVVAAPGEMFRLDTRGALLKQQSSVSFGIMSVGASSPGGTVLVASSELAGAPPTPVLVSNVDATNEDTWRVQLGGSYNLYGLVSATAGYTVLGGDFSNTMQVGSINVVAPPSKQPSLPGAGDFLAEITPAGEVAWATEISAIGSYARPAVAVDTCGTAFVAVPTPSGVAVGAYDDHGTRVWTRRFAGLDEAKVLIAPVPGSRDVVLAGSTGTAVCEDACPCYAPRPFLFRLRRDGAVAPGFEAHL